MRANSAGSSATDGGKSVVQSQAEGLRADAKRKEGEGKAFQAELQMLDAIVEQAISLLVDAGDRFSRMMDSIVDSSSDRSDSLSRVRFGG